MTITHADIKKERRTLALEGGASQTVYRALEIAERYLDGDANRVAELERALETLYETASKYKKRVGAADEPLLVALHHTEKLLAHRGGGASLSERVEAVVTADEEDAEQLQRAAAILRRLEDAGSKP